METFREFCADSLRQKKLAGEFKERSDPLRLTLKRTKRNIENFFIQNDVETAKVVLKDHDPPITYLTRNNKVQCRRITRETVEEGLEHCFEDLTDEQISDTEVLGKCIWESIHRARQVDRLVLRISNKPEDKRRMLAGGEDAPYTLDLSAKIGVLVKNYWAATEDLKRLRKTKKEKESVLSERIKQRCPVFVIGCDDDVAVKDNDFMGCDVVGKSLILISSGGLGIQPISCGSFLDIIQAPPLLDITKMKPKIKRSIKSSVHNTFHMIMKFLVCTQPKKIPN